MIQVTEEGLDKLRDMIEREFRRQFFKQGLPLAEKVLSEICAKVMADLKIDANGKTIRIVLEIR